MSTFAPPRDSLNAEHTIRMLGENITLTGWKWSELLDEMREDSDLARRIRERLMVETCAHGVPLSGANGEFVTCDGCDEGNAEADLHR